MSARLTMSVSQLSSCRRRLRLLRSRPLEIGGLANVRGRAMSAERFATPPLEAKLKSNLHQRVCVCVCVCVCERALRADSRANEYRTQLPATTITGEATDRATRSWPLAQHERNDPQSTAEAIRDRCRLAAARTGACRSAAAFRRPSLMTNDVSRPLRLSSEFAIWILLPTARMRPLVSFGGLLALARRAGEFVE